MLQGVPPMPHAPPEGSFQAAMAGRTPSSSPGPKTSTPCSLQTTPDLSRRSYIATSTNGGFTPRSSTQSLQPRLAQMPSMSRLPTPKTRNPPSSNDDEDTPPPVPAIPKQYESPKDAPVDQSMFSLRKSHLPYDSASLNSRNSSSTNEWSATSSGKERAIKVKSMGPLPRSSFMSGSRTDAEQKSKVTPVKKQLQPLRLPPLNLLPLSTPTAAKISQMTSDPSKQVHGRQTPPGRVAAKTPSTPMTASKTSFFSSRSRAQQPTVASQSRSSTSTSHQRQGTGQESPSKPIPAPARPPRQNAVSPFVSSSLPKSSGEHHFFGRSKPSVDSTHDTTTEQRQSRVNGPRAQQKLTKSPKREQAPPRSPPKTDAEPTGSSIRRKLSLSWKRGNSKSSITLVNDKEAADVPPQPPKHDSKYGDMPPPRLPASATTGNLANYTNTRSPKKIAPSPSDSLRSVKSTKSTTNYLDTKRRKSSLSNNDPAVMQQREEQKLQDKWGLTEQSTTKPQVAERKLTALPTDTPKHNLSSSRSSSAIVNSTQRILGPKPSMMSLRPSIERERWTEGLDKDDLIAEEEIRRLAMRRKETEQAARVLDALMKRATPKDRVSPRTALESGARLNIFERGEIVDFRDVYFCGTSSADKHVGDSQNTNNNHGYDDERGDYGIVIGDHLSYRYEIIDVLGKGSFGQVVRCIDHKTGLLVAVKIIRNKKRFHQQALVEVDILQKLRDWVRANTFPLPSDLPVYPSDPRTNHTVPTGSQGTAFIDPLYVLVLLPWSSVYLDRVAKYELV